MNRTTSTGVESLMVARASFFPAWDRQNHHHWSRNPRSHSATPELLQLLASFSFDGFLKVHC